MSCRKRRRSSLSRYPNHEQQHIVPVLSKNHQAIQIQTGAQNLNPDKLSRSQRRRLARQAKVLTNSNIQDNYQQNKDQVSSNEAGEPDRKQEKQIVIGKSEPMKLGPTQIDDFNVKQCSKSSAVGISGWKQEQRMQQLDTIYDQDPVTHEKQLTTVNDTHYWQTNKHFVKNTNGSKATNWQLLNTQTNTHNSDDQLRRVQVAAANRERKHNMNAASCSQNQTQNKLPVLLERRICQYWSLGICRKNDSCPFEHVGPRKKTIMVCKFLLSGCKNKDCIYNHDKSNIPCRFFSLGTCRKDNCEFKHVMLSKEEKLALINDTSTIMDVRSHTRLTKAKTVPLLVQKKTSDRVGGIETDSASEAHDDGGLVTINPFDEHDNVFASSLADV